MNSASARVIFIPILFLPCCNNSKMQSASPDPTSIYPQEQMQSEEAAEIVLEPTTTIEPTTIDTPEPDSIQSSSVPATDKDHENENENDNENETVICRWNQCNQPFASHNDLADHLSKGKVYLSPC